MAAPTLEKARGCHEEIELIEKAIVRSLTEDPKNHKDSIHRSHYVNSLLNLSLQKHKELVAVYEDKDGALERDMNDLSGNGLDVFSNLNDRVNEIKKYYSQFHVQLEPTEEFVVFPEEIRFSGEEGYGRYLDLHEHYETFLNLSFVKANAFAQLDYFSFLSSFFKFDVFPSLPHDKPYRAYLDNLLNYLIDFVQRSQPLYELEETLRQTDEEFAALYASGFRSWSSPSSTSSSADAPQEVSDAITTSDPKQTSSNPLFCAACNKTFSKQTVFDAHLKAAKHLKAFQQMEAQQKDFLFVEFKINKLGQVLADKISDTKINIEKKQARTYDVIEGDLEDDEDYEESDDEEEEEDNEENRMRIQNYPVGWDGKPIPYWLYKLHGLGTEFKCEICGNTSFWGRRAFERHFQEPRHNQGMKAIGVPNTKHFHEITRVKDALELWKKIQKDREREEWNQEQGEEFEDSEGNVISKKIFSDLKRQGLLKF